MGKMNGEAAVRFNIRMVKGTEVVDDPNRMLRLLTQIVSDREQPMERRVDAIQLSARHARGLLFLAARPSPRGRG
jgi:hypothetical protein